MADAPTTAPFVHHGRLGQVLGMALFNGFLNMATLSWYRFWGNTQIRRLLWSHTTAWGEPFDYTGTGKELFLGFLLVFGVVLVPLMLAGIGMEMLAEGNPDLALFGWIPVQVIFLFLAGAGLYRARRYRLSRTMWRGIRGGQDGSAWRYGLMFLAAIFLGFATLGWAWPWAEMWLQRYKLSNTTFGNRRFECHASARSTYKSFAIFWLVGLALSAALIGLGALAVQYGKDLPLWRLPAETLVGLPILAGTLILVVVAIFYVRYRATFYRALATATGFAGATVSLRFGAWDLARLGLGNWLMTVLSLGLLSPLAAWRNVHFLCTSLHFSQEPDFAVIAQGAAAEGRTGEGLAAMFDGAGAL
jgi:uncharacterized membrane protein YjgN (DUF898 family)